MNVISKLFVISTVGVSFLLPGMTHAQSSTLLPKIERQVTSSGGKGFVANLVDVDGTALDYNIDFTVGEIAVKAINYPDYVHLHQGFHQGALSLPKLNADEMLVYPNPTDDKLRIKYNLDANVKRVDVRVINLYGRMVFSEANTSINPLSQLYEYELNVSDYVPGIYLVTIIFDTGIKVTRKFVKFD